MNKEGRVDFSKTRTVNLGEYIGLDEDNDQSYRYFINKNLFNNINIDKNNTKVPASIVQLHPNVTVIYSEN